MTFMTLAEAMKRKPNGLPAGDHCVYCLVDPDGTIRYIGQYSHPRRIKMRLKQHRHHPVNRLMKAWLQFRKRSGKPATIHILQFVRAEDLETAEEDWIRWVAGKANLLNVQHGQTPRAPKILDSTRSTRVWSPEDAESL